MGLGPRGMMQHGRRATGELAGSAFPPQQRFPAGSPQPHCNKDSAGPPRLPCSPTPGSRPSPQPPAPCPHSPAPRGPAQARCEAARGGSGAGTGLGHAPRRGEGCGLRAAPQGPAASPQAGGDLILQAAFGVLTRWSCPVPSQPVPGGEGSPRCAPCQRSAGSRLHPAMFWPRMHEPLSALGLCVSGVSP